MNKKILHTVLAQSAFTFGDNIAIEHGDRSISYSDLGETTQRLARHLQSLDVGKDMIVGVYLENSIEFVASIIAIMKAGAMFMPLDLFFPADRIKTLIEKTRPVIVLTASHTREKFMEIETQSGISPPYLLGEIDTGLNLCVDQTRVPADKHHLMDRDPEKWEFKDISEPDDANYIFFTSGSTGQPKAIVGCHKGLSHFIHWEAKEFGFDQTTRVTQFAPVSFDACLKDIFVPLLVGGTLCIPPRQIRQNVSLLLDWISENRLTVVHCVPSLFRALMTEIEQHPLPGQLLPELKHVILAGDALYGKDVKRWTRLFDGRIELVNFYGPTETTLIKTFHRIRTCPENEGSIIHVGQPISNAAVLVVKGNRLCDIGEIGDIYIKTPFMTKGYYHDPELTQMAFVRNPLTHDSDKGDSDIVYRTGDLGRYLPDRSLEFIGRLDFQVKVNGIRMDLSEIEKTLMRMPGLDQAVVAAFRNSEHENQLVCYYVINQTGTTNVTATQIRDFLKQYLPEYMVPFLFMALTELPLNLNGKINRKALPKPEELLYKSTDMVLPQTEVEKKLAGIWQEVLGIAKVSTDSLFFEIGGHSLKAIQIVSRIYKQFNVEIRLKDFFENATIKEQARLIENTRPSGVTRIEPVLAQPAYELSHAQKRLWILSQLDEDKIAYSMPGIYLVTGALDHLALQASFNALIDRHESLRTVFETRQGSPVQCICNTFPGKEFSIDRIAPDGVGSTQTPPAQKDLIDMARPYVEQEIGQAFDLETGPLLRVKMICFSDTRHLIIFNMHHIIGDAWSIDVLARELFELYKARIENRPVKLPPLRIQYKDFSAWQNDLLLSNKIARHATYWHDKLSGQIPILNLHTDYVRPKVVRYLGKTITFSWEKSLVDQIQALARQNQASLFMALLSGIKIMLFRYTGQQDIIVGSPMAGRDHPDLEHQVGFYVNTLALRDQLKPEHTVCQVLENVKQTALEAYEHQVYPFDRLVDELDLVRDVGRAPLFDVMMVFQNMDYPELRVNDTVFTEIDIETGTAKFDLTFIFSFHQDKLTLGLNYNQDLFSEATINRMAGHLKQIVSQMVDNSKMTINQLNMLEKTEYHQILHDFTRTGNDYPLDKSLVTLFEEQAWLHELKPAVIFSDKLTTYQEMNLNSHGLAWLLIDHYKISKGDVIGLMVDRSDKSVILMLAILRAGAVCLPLDPTYPDKRLIYMLDNTDCSLVIVENDKVSGFDVKHRMVSENTLFAQAASIDAKERILPAVDSQSPALILYTSGSTGIPKGVALCHRGFVNMVMGLIESFELTADDNVLQFAAYSFDVSISEIFMTLLCGACLVVTNRETIDSPLDFMDCLMRNKVSVAALYPMYLNTLDKNVIRQLRVLITGGEPPHEADVAFYARHTCYFNAYGPTEASSYATLHKIDPDYAYQKSIPIGKPLPNTAILILDESLNLMPVGGVGEICITGAGLAQGYLNQPELTARRFIRNPFDNGKRIYKTGDVGYLLPNGEVVFLGRTDEQIKIRGFRVELGEIENHLIQLDHIKQAVVVKDSNLSQLAAYVVCTGTLDTSYIKSVLAAYLPEYMIPAFFVQMDQLPKTPSGKIDKKALPDPRRHLHNPTQRIEPRNQTESQLLELFRDVLKAPDMGVCDHFFDLGGTSLAAIKLMSRIFQTLSVKVSAKQLFLNPTVERLAKAMATCELKNEPAVFPDMRQQQVSVRIQRQSLFDKIMDGQIQPIDAAAIEYLPDELKLDKHDIITDWTGGVPVLTTIIDTFLGRVGMIMLPCFASELYKDADRLSEHILTAMKMAKKAGAQTVSMTGLIPSATNQGQTVLSGMDVNNGFPVLTTGQATVTAVLVMTVETIFARVGRQMSEQRLAMLGLDMVGKMTLELILTCLPHPEQLLLYDNQKDGNRLEQIKNRIQNDFGFKGMIQTYRLGQNIQEHLHDASLIVATGNMFGQIDIESLGSGTILICDPGQDSFNRKQALVRLKTRSDILFTESDLLSVPQLCSYTSYLPENIERQMPIDHLNAYTHKAQDQITGCVLSGLLSSRHSQVPVTTGDIDVKTCQNHYDWLKKLGFEAATPRYENIRFSDTELTRFIDQYGNPQLSAKMGRKI